MTDKPLPPPMNHDHVSHLPPSEPSTLSRDALSGCSDPVVTIMVNTCRHCGRDIPQSIGGDGSFVCRRCQ